MKCLCGQLYELVTKNNQLIAICPKCGDEQASHYIGGYIRRIPNRNEKDSKSPSIRGT
jgi:5-methylcytosine-specific restriction endonuclease McrA